MSLRLLAISEPPFPKGVGIFLYGSGSLNLSWEELTIFLSKATTLQMSQAGLLSPH
jgi:hypothetical protein